MIFLKLPLKIFVWDNFEWFFWLGQIIKKNILKFWHLHNTAEVLTRISLSFWRHTSSYKPNLFYTLFWEERVEKWINAFFVSNHRKCCANFAAPHIVPENAKPQIGFNIKRRANLCRECLIHLMADEFFIWYEKIRWNKQFSLITVFWCLRKESCCRNRTNFWQKISNHCPEEIC